MNNVFISGSIAIKHIPHDVQESIKRIIEQDMHILVGDADGIDSMVQKYCQQQGYSNVTVYSIYPQPRNMIGGFQSKQIIPKIDSKKERELQQEKDAAMTADSHYSLVIWDGKSKGSYNNVIRAFNENKKVKLYLHPEQKFVERKKMTKAEIEFIFRKNNGYSAAEVVQFLKDQGEEYFQNTRAFNKILLDNEIIKKENGIYAPLPNYQELFIIDQYRGKVKGIKFKNEFIDWVEDWLKKIKPPEEQVLF